MKKKVGHPFYNSSKWRKVRLDYLNTVHHICELCGKPAQQVHHIDPLTDKDYYLNYEKCYGFANLQALCRDCHNHMDKHFLSGKGKQAIAEGYSVDMVTGEVLASPRG